VGAARRVYAASTLAIVRLGVVADVHGNSVALEAVLAEAADFEVDCWWALGDLVLFGPRPVEVLQILAELPGIAYVSGNTDRYVLTGEQPAPHETPAHAVGDLDLVERHAAMAGAIGWTRGALVQAGLLSVLSDMPSEQRLRLPDDTLLLGVHASPRRDDGQGIDSRVDAEELAQLLEGCGASTVVGGHTHDPTDRVLGSVRALNPGSVGVPGNVAQASWMLIEADADGVHTRPRETAYDVDLVVRDLHTRGYPNASFVESLLTGTRSLAQSLSDRS
jgi:predicted phosphodiesterase